MASGLYKFYWDCGRNGSIDGAFIADEEEVLAIIGTEVAMGEVLGKHSDIYGTIEPGEITLVTQDPAVLEALKGFSVGVNPLDYIYVEE